MEINNQNLLNFRLDFMDAIKSLEEKYGMRISLGSITYEADRFSAKLTAVNGKDSDEVARNNFDADVWKYKHLGFSEGDYKRVFIGIDGNRYAILGFNTKAPKYPLIIQRISDSSKVRAHENYVKEICDEFFAQ